MQLSHPAIEKVCPEVEVFENVLSLDHQDILELGCGDATLTRLIATAGSNRTITAAEVDTIQHQKNLLIEDLPNVSFVLAGAENIPVEDSCIDTVFMFKSLHHVPVDSMDQALAEITRVLKPGGKAYISEPIYAGEFNDILKMFHDEQSVRLAAFEALQRIVASRRLELADQLFFYSPLKFENFEQFADRVMGVTHTSFQLTDELISRVEAKFKQTVALNQGEFRQPIRVDLLFKSI